MRNGVTAVIRTLLIYTLSGSVLGKMRPDVSDNPIVVPYMQFNSASNSGYIATFSGI